MKLSSARVGLTLAALLATHAAIGQDFKAPIRIVVPFSAGGATDVLARMVAPRISAELGQPVLIDNKPGANGMIGAQLVKAAPADGSTFLVTTEHPIVILPFITPNVSYAAERDFLIIGKIANLQWTLSTPASTGAKSLTEFVSYVKGDATRGNYGVPSDGGVPQMIGQVIGQKAQVDMTVLPFAGGAPIVTNLMGGQISSGVTGAPEALQMQKSGKVHVLGISGKQRSPHLPTVPTFEELGYPGLTVESWFGVFAPKNLPGPLAERFNKALNAALADPQVKQRISELSLQPTPTSLTEANTEFVSAVAFWRAATPPQAAKR